MTAIALGWRCHSATWAVDTGLRPRKSEGYLTCPFDLMISNYPGLVQCFKDGLDDLYNINYLTLLTTPLASQWKGRHLFTIQNIVLSLIMNRPIMAIYIIKNNGLVAPNIL